MFYLTTHSTHIVYGYMEGRKEMFYLTTHSTHIIYGYMEGRKEMFYLTMHSTHFIYGYMASDIWLRTILIVRKETRCRHIGYSFRLTARVLLYAPSHRQDSTYQGLCYTSRGALAGMRNSPVGSPHEGSIQRPIAPWANALTTEPHLAPYGITSHENKYFWKYTIFHNYQHDPPTCIHTSTDRLLDGFFGVVFFRKLKK